MKPEVWGEHVRPALSTRGREGWAWFIGVPRGRNHFYDIYMNGIDDSRREWDSFHWKSADILSPNEIKLAKEELDPITFQQEYEADFVNFEGRAYYQFDRNIHARETLEYKPDLPLIFCFDFNTEPGVCVILQEQKYIGSQSGIDSHITAVIGEVWIPRNSTTPAICRKLIADWKHHKGEVWCYGDSTGGAKGTAKESGSDWDLIRNYLRPVFHDNLIFRVPKSNPKERVRVNSVNSRLMSADDRVHMLLDPKKAANLINDFEGVVLLKGGSGEIHKEPGSHLTHASDAIGYYITNKFPLGRGVFVSERV